MKVVPKCVECGADCIVERPATVLISLWHFDIHILNHKKKVYSKYCNDCFLDISTQSHRDALYEAGRSGYEKCMNDYGL